MITNQSAWSAWDRLASGYSTFSSELSKSQSNSPFMERPFSNLEIHSSQMTIPSVTLVCREMREWIGFAEADLMILHSPRFTD